MDEKRLLRTELLQKRKALPAAEKHALEQAMQQNVIADAAFQAAQVVCCYLSMPHEWCTDDIVQEALRRGKTVCAPRCMPDGTMQMHRLDGADAALTVSTFGVREPAQTAQVLAPEAIDFMVVPALASTPDGYRLGYGKGYYDRYMCGCAAVSVVLCAEADVTKRVPVEAHDVPCTKIATEKQVITNDEK